MSGVETGEDKVVELHPAGAQAPQEQATDEQGAGQESPPELSPLERSRQELAETTARLKTVSAGYIKIQEEMVAFKARLERQKALKEQILKGDVVSKLFEPLENLRRSLDAMGRAGVDADLLSGMEATHKGFLEGFHSLGLEEIGAQGERFDPNYHEALTLMPVQEEALDDHVVQVFAAGYRVGTRVIRPAKVIVGSYTAPAEAEPQAVLAEDSGNPTEH